MSLRFEQYNSLLQTKELLRKMIEPNFKKLSASEIKKLAYRCLRHFPHLDENGKPHFSKDEFDS